ncbi:Smr domain-containing protein [Psilocybe cubensis]|uniref:Smr domain-containing protein n=2 Tax=Psilocybe cubensis TaxID=181762 RepID=A0A8H8CHN4_PSICU|nr:Smr domain-containing protein [Psilocybe cubensis]KAH9479696.1 Smr domain-containing protein [Psilocybe cubensis]
MPMTTYSSTKSLFESLQTEFCPTLDSSLIAALLAEIEFDSDGNAVDPTQDQIDFLRTTLSELSLHAEEAQESEFSDVQLVSQFEETISSWTTPDNSPETAGSQSTGSSGTSISSTQSFGSPLRFLQAALPDVPTARLTRALEDAEKMEVDMWDIVAAILTEESIREMEERGWDGSEDGSCDAIDDTNWEVVEVKKPLPKSERKKAQTRSKKIALADIRQQHHINTQLLVTNNKLPRKHPPVGPAADIWTQMSSFSDHIATLLPPHPPSFFLSFFHSPNYGTSYEALRAALTSLCKDFPAGLDHHTTVLYNLLDIILPEYEDCDVAQRTRLISDVELAVAVTRGKGDESLDLVNLLRDLDSDCDMGLYHLQPAETWTDDKSNRKLPARTVQLPSGPPPVEPPPVSRVKQKAAPPSTSLSKPSPFQWQAVPKRKTVDRAPHSLAHHIPAYARDVNGKKTTRTSRSNSIAASSNPDFRLRMNEAMRKRNDALREAARMWQRGNSKSRGGEIAFYFAERAREFQELAKTEALNAAREMVSEKRNNSQNKDTVDLHGTTVAEAIAIVKEILKNEGSTISQAKPLKIITGRGSHSHNQISVLKPAVRKALVEDGWTVGSWDGGLIVFDLYLPLQHVFLTLVM